MNNTAEALAAKATRSVAARFLPVADAFEFAKDLLYWRVIRQFAAGIGEQVLFRHLDGIIGTRVFNKLNKRDKSAPA